MDKKFFSVLSAILFFFSLTSGASAELVNFDSKSGFIESEESKSAWLTETKTCDQINLYETYSDGVLRDNYLMYQQNAYNGINLNESGGALNISGSTGTNFFMNGSIFVQGVFAYPPGFSIPVPTPLLDGDFVIEASYKDIVADWLDIGGTGDAVQIYLNLQYYGESKWIENYFIATGVEGTYVKSVFNSGIPISIDANINNDYSFKITRVGGTVSTYYKENLGNWNLIGSSAMGTGKINISSYVLASSSFQNRPVSFKVDDVRIYCPSATGPFSNWQVSGGSSRKVSMNNVTGGTGADKLFQSVRGTEGHIWTRMSTDGSNWGAWSELGATPGNIVMGSVEDKLLQSVRGNEGWLWTRVYDNDTQAWSSWSANGGTAADVAMVNNGNKLMQSIRGNDGKLYTRIYDNSTETWGSWIADISITGNPSLASSISTVLIMQTVRDTSNIINTRFYNTSSQTWSSWVKSGSTKDEISTHAIGTKFFQSVRGNEGWLWTRIYDFSTQSWSSWVADGGTRMAPGLGIITSQNKLIQAVTGNDGQLWFRFYDNATSTWGTWTQKGESKFQPTVAEFGSNAYISIVDLSNIVSTGTFN